MIESVVQDASEGASLAGDAAAAEGNWRLAVSLWSASLNGPERVDAERRIRWFLDEVAPPSSLSRDTGRETDHVILLTGCGLGILGTAIVLFGFGRDGAVQDLVSVAAWLCFVAASALAVAWAWRAGRPRPRPGPVTDADVARALHLANRLDRDCAADLAPPA